MRRTPWLAQRAGKGVEAVSLPELTACTPPLLPAAASCVLSCPAPTVALNSGAVPGSQGFSTTAHRKRNSWPCQVLPHPTPPVRTHG